MIATISEYRDFVKVVGDQILTPDENGDFWLDVHPGIPEEQIELARQMGVKFRAKPTEEFWTRTIL